jgi:hypothetical protein
MEIKLQGSEESFRKLVVELNSNFLYIARDQGHPVYLLIQDIEDQLEPNAERAHDFIDLDEIFEE